VGGSRRKVKKTETHKEEVIKRKKEGTGARKQ